MECADLIMSEPGVDVNFQDNMGRTLLVNNIMLSYQASTLSTIKLLLQEKGADPNKTDAKGWTPVCTYYINWVCKYIRVFSSSKMDTDPVNEPFVGWGGVTQRGVGGHVPWNIFEISSS